MKLNEFYEIISSPSGIEVKDFQCCFRNIFELDRPEYELQSYRLSAGPWKKLSDEVSPLSQYLFYRQIDAGKVRFPLDSHTPDCWYYPADHSAPIGIEITISQARERFHLAKELVEKGEGRGFIGVGDDAPQADFNKAMARPRRMYTSDQALVSTSRGILRCLQRKMGSQYLDFVLLIQAPLRSLSHERWDQIQPALRNQASMSPFREIHVISNVVSSAWGFQLK